MGLSIHYSGKIKNIQLIPEFIQELYEICTILSWKNTIIHNDEVNGIIFSPKNCEPFFFTFTGDGHIISPLLLQYKIEPATTISVKTQYAGIDVHISVVKLLRYLSKKYFSDFNMNDEGYYWETNFSRYHAILEFMVETLQNLPARNNETAESLADRIESMLKKKGKN